MSDSDNLNLPSLQELQSAEQMELLDIVDSLRACGLSEIVALPQLIVCGDQSSGKSSVLEAISGIPFPRQDDLCTRFATEVILRRAPKDDISVSIIPGRDRTQADHDRLIRFHHELKTKDGFNGLFDLARDAMGLSAESKSFSDDVLRIEFCGPSQPQLTLVDLPGLIHTETKSQRPGDVELVHQLVSQYLENPRSIILAVISAKNDISNQIILRKVRAPSVDPHGARTLGIITKPDLLPRGSKSEKAFIALARNEEVKFSLGWHVIKNLDLATTQDQVGSRDEEEKLFFQSSNFNSLPAHTIGITFLRSRLSKVLFSQIRTELPRLVEDINTQLTISEAAKIKLGPSRMEPHEQQSFLISLGQSFQALCRDAVRGDYDHEFFRLDSNPERRLCADVMNKHFEFARIMRQEGSTWHVLNDDDDEYAGYVEGEVDEERYRTRDEAIADACDLLRISRGRELPGLPNPRVVGELFRQYSKPWESLARAHIRKVWDSTHRFLELLLRELTDEEACENLLRVWIHPAMDERLNVAYGKLDELLEVHKDYPLTTNNLFLERSKKLRAPTQEDQVEDVVAEIVASGQILTADKVREMFSEMSQKKAVDMDMLAAEEAFDNMNAYYKVALDLFTDNVPTLALQGPIMREIPRIFCPTSVSGMGPELMRKIAGESEEKMSERAVITHKIKVLEDGAKICKMYAKRSQSYYSTASDGVSELPTVGSRASGGNGRSPRPYALSPRSLRRQRREEATAARLYNQLSTVQTGEIPQSTTIELSSDNSKSTSDALEESKNVSSRSSNRKVSGDVDIKKEPDEEVNLYGSEEEVDADAYDNEEENEAEHEDEGEEDDEEDDEEENDDEGEEDDEEEDEEENDDEDQEKYHSDDEFDELREAMCSSPSRPSTTTLGGHLSEPFHEPTGAKSPSLPLGDSKTTPLSALGNEQPFSNSISGNAKVSAQQASYTQPFIFNPTGSPSSGHFGDPKPSNMSKSSKSFLSSNLRTPVTSSGVLLDGSTSSTQQTISTPTPVTSSSAPSSGGIFGQRATGHTIVFQTAEDASKLNGSGGFGGRYDSQASINPPHGAFHFPANMNGPGSAQSAVAHNAVNGPSAFGPFGQAPRASSNPPVSLFGGSSVLRDAPASPGIFVKPEPVSSAFGSGSPPVPEAKSNLFTSAPKPTPRTSSSGFNFGGMQPKSTFFVKYVASVEQEPCSGPPYAMTSYKHICFMPEYQNYSPEELRLSDIGGWLSEGA